MLDNRELVIWPEDVNARRLLGAYRRRARGIDGPFAALERDRLAASWSEGVRGKATELRRHGWSLRTLAAKFGIGFVMPKAWVLASGLARVTSRAVRSLICGKACRKSA